MLPYIISSVPLLLFKYNIPRDILYYIIVRNRYDVFKYEIFKQKEIKVVKLSLEFVKKNIYISYYNAYMVYLLAIIPRGICIIILCIYFA